MHNTLTEEIELNGYIDSLNPEQLEAVTTTEGPLLVLAGAGTGKTKVLTTRIAHILMQRKAFPGQILAVTFTNKAAREMKERVERIISGVEGLWLGTFHSIAAKILRRHADLVGLKKDFIIIDMEDQKRLCKQIVRDLKYDEKKYPPKLVSYIIGKFKDKGLTPEKAVDSGFVRGTGEAEIAIYREYQKRLVANNSCDFGDLMMYNIEILKNHPDVLREYQNKFKYILVDEYQDTNVSQYLWLRLLTQENKNICCVGDDDQSIYGWRGAEVTNILRFDQDYKGAKVIRLEQNYRSTAEILKAATNLISQNLERHGKELWTAEKQGEKIKLNSFYDEREEARYIADEIESMQISRKHKLSDMAILLRAGYQTRSFEESLNFLRIPYKIIGGVKFYERAEIKDSIAYIRLLVNPSDNLAFERVINTPKRGVGIASIQNLMQFARENGMSMYDGIERAKAEGVIKGKAASAISEFAGEISKWRESLKSKNHWEVVDDVLLDTGYIEMWKAEGTDEAKDRIENIKELLRSLEEYGDLTEFLEHVSLLTDVDSMVDDNRVNIMTMHAAKGLEFETVFLAGWEEGIFPSQKAIDENGKSALEEERRLAYVAITRAKKNLYICFANNRRMYGSYQACLPSRFINEIPVDSYEIVNSSVRFGNRFSQNGMIGHKEKIPSFRDEDFSQVSQAKFKLGQRVFHQKFGYGKIIDLHDEIAEVSFEKSSVKKVMVDYLKG